MKKIVLNYIKASLRRTWGRSKQRQFALANAKVSYGKYLCAVCNDIFARKQIQVDHIIAVGRFIDFNTYIERLFCESSGLRVLCIDCHKKKTKKDIKSFKRNVII
jgi:5-methylcytosine-specific restriction endonuclease McrA